MNITDYITNKTDILYNNFSKENRRMVILYIFSFFIIGVDCTSFFIAMDKYKVFGNSKKQFWIILIPGLIEWIITLLSLIYYKYKLRIIKNQVMEIIEGCKSNMRCANDDNIKSLSKKLNLRTKYYKNDIFEKCLILIIIFLFPIGLKIIIFRKCKYKKFFSICSLIIFGIMFLSSLIELIIVKLKSYFQMKKNNLKYFSEKYPLNEKIIEIQNYSKNNKTYISEIFMNIAFFIVKGFLFFLFIIYFSQIGDKLDDPIKGSSWIYLFIPMFICFIPLIVYSIIHCISLYKLFKGKIWIIIFTIIPCNFSFMINSFLIPMILDNRISITYYSIPIIFSIGTLFFGIHIKYVNSKLRKYK